MRELPIEDRDNARGDVHDQIAVAKISVQQHWTLQRRRKRFKMAESELQHGPLCSTRTIDAFIALQYVAGVHDLQAAWRHRRVDSSELFSTLSREQRTY